VCSTRRAARTHLVTFAPLQMHFCPPSKFGPPGCLGPVDGNSSVGHSRSSALKHPRAANFNITRTSWAPKFPRLSLPGTLGGRPHLLHSQASSPLRRPRPCPHLQLPRPSNCLGPQTSSNLHVLGARTSSALKLPRRPNFPGGQACSEIKLPRPSDRPKMVEYADVK